MKVDGAGRAQSDRSNRRRGPVVLRERAEIARLVRGNRSATPDALVQQRARVEIQHLVARLVGAVSEPRIRSRLHALPRTKAVQEERGVLSGHDLEHSPKLLLRDVESAKADGHHGATSQTMTASFGTWSPSTPPIEPEDGALAITEVVPT